MVINYLLGIVREGQFKWLIGHVRELHGVVKKEKKGILQLHKVWTHTLYSLLMDKWLPYR